MSHRLLVLYAHPDDEVLGPGGTIALYAKNGVEVELVCATRGEAGEIADPALATPDTLPQVRERELLCSASTLGIGQVHFLDYRDSGMANSAENEHPQAFINVSAEEVVAKLVGIIRAFQPQVLLTFEPWGGYGHPDHIAINHHTLAAFDRAGDADYRPDLGAPWSPTRLFYPYLPSQLFAKLNEALEAAGHEVQEMERWEEMRANSWPDDQVNCIVDVSSTIDAKWQAFHCHATQFGPDNPFRKADRAILSQALQEEYFALARPRATDGRQFDTLFDDIE